VVEDHAGAINYDLMKLGLRLRQLGTGALSWGDLRDYVRYGNTETALALETHGSTVLWGVTDHLLAVVADALHNANWQRGGGKGSKPQPIPRPGVEGDAVKMGAEPIPAADFWDWWNEE
jgi:hypothetical protein